MAEQSSCDRSSNNLAELEDNDSSASESLVILSESENMYENDEMNMYENDDLLEIPELESESSSSDQDSVPELESDSGNSEVQWGNPLNIELQGKWIQASVAVDESDWLGSLSSDSWETQHPSDDGVGFGVECVSARAYVDDLAMLVNDVNYEEDGANGVNYGEGGANALSPQIHGEDGANALSPQINQDEQGNGSDSSGVERGGGTRETVSSREGLLPQMQNEIGMELLNDDVRDDQEDEDRIQIEFEDDLVDENGEKSSGGPAQESSFERP